LANRLATEFGKEAKYSGLARRKQNETGSAMMGMAGERGYRMAGAGWKVGDLATGPRLAGGGGQVAAGSLAAHNIPHGGAGNHVRLNTADEEEEEDKYEDPIECGAASQARHWPWAMPVAGRGSLLEFCKNWGNLGWVKIAAPALRQLGRKSL